MGLDGFLAIMADPFQMLYAVLCFQIQVFSFFGHNVARLFQVSFSKSFPQLVNPSFLMNFSSDINGIITARNFEKHMGQGHALGLTGGADGGQAGPVFGAVQVGLNSIFFF